jgi:hypothetical protein
VLISLLSTGLTYLVFLGQGMAKILPTQQDNKLGNQVGKTKDFHIKNRVRVIVNTFHVSSTVLSTLHMSFLYPFSNLMRKNLTFLF